MIRTQHRHSNCHAITVIVKWAKVLVCLVPMLQSVDSSAAVDYDSWVNHDVVYQNTNEIPQWKDIGLEDLLVVDNQPTVPTCRVTRPVQSLSNGEVRALMALASTNALFNELVQELVVAHGRNVYFLQSLRL